MQAYETLNVSFCKPWLHYFCVTWCESKTLVSINPVFDILLV